MRALSRFHLRTDLTCLIFSLVHAFYLASLNRFLATGYIVHTTCNLNVQRKCAPKVSYRAESPIEVIWAFHMMKPYCSLLNKGLYVLEVRTCILLSAVG
ncbi:hypothetical protein FKM82_008781 [Ascaphus truei]